MVKEWYLRREFQKVSKMFFDGLDQVVELAKKCGTAIFVVPKDFDVSIKNAIVLQP